MATPAGWDPIQTRKHRAGADAFHLSPFARLARAHVLVAAGDALLTIALANSLFFDLDPNDARVEGVPLPRAHDGTARPRGPVHRAGARPLGRGAALDDRGRERGAGARVPRDDRRPRRAAAVPRGVRGAGHGEGLRRLQERRRAHRGAQRRRARGGELQAPAALRARRPPRRAPGGDRVRDRRVRGGAGPGRRRLRRGHPRGPAHPPHPGGRRARHRRGVGRAPRRRHPPRRVGDGPRARDRGLPHLPPAVPAA